MNDFILFTVGEKLDEMWTKVVPQEMGGATLVMDSNNIMIVCGLPNITRQELEATRNGTLHLGLYRHGDALIVMMEIRGFVVFDLPYDYRVGPAEGRGHPKNRKPNEGFAVTTVIFDSLTGRVANLRMSSVTPQFSERLEAIVGDFARRSNDQEWNYMRDLQSIYRKYPRPDRIWPHCEIAEQVGIKFPK